MSTETSILDLILRIRKAGGGDKEVAAAMKDVIKTTKEAAEENKGMVKGLADVKAGFDMVTQVLGYAQQAFDATVGKAAAWGDEMGDLSQLTGTSVRDTSELAATMELLGIKSDSLTKVIKAMTAQGLQPTMDNIRKLADEYQAIQDPVEKNEFLFKRFGKQAGDIAEVLGKTSSELDTFTAAARRSGKVIDEETAAAGERLNVQLATLQQRVEGAGIAIGNLFIPVLNTAITAGDQLTQIWQYAGIEFAKNIGLIDQTTASTAEMTAFGIQPATTATENMTVATAEAAGEFDTFGMAAYGAASAAWSVAVKEQEAAKAARDLKMAESDLASAIAGPIGEENQKYIDQQAELRVKSRELKEELEKLEIQQGQQVTTTSSSTLSANELNLAQLKLADAQKKLSEATDPMKQAALQVEIDKLTGKIAGASTTTTGYVDNSKRIGEIKTELDGVNAAFDLNAQKHEEATARIVFGFVQQRMAADGLQDGEITALAEIGKAWGIYDQDTANALAAVDKAITEHGANAKAIIGDVGQAIKDLPDTKTIRIDVQTNNARIGNEDFGGWTPPAGAKSSGAGGAVEEGVKIGGANGLDIIVPPGYPNDSFPVWAQSGERVTITPPGQMSGSVTNNYYLNVTSASSSLGVSNDFALMKALSGV